MLEVVSKLKHVTCFIFPVDRTLSSRNITLKTTCTLSDLVFEDLQADNVMPPKSYYVVIMLLHRISTDINEILLNEDKSCGIQ